MIYTCIIAEDNEIERDLLQLYVNKIPQLQLVAVCEDGLQAATIIAAQQVDIVLCDIDMPNLNGMELLKSLRHPSSFIFITSFKDYAIESFDLDVIDFVLKPVSFARLLKAVNKAIDYLKLKAANGHPVTQDPASKSPTGGVADDYFFIKESYGITRLKYSDVEFIESMGDFSKIHTVKNHTHIVLTGLKNFEPQLPGNIFKRIHKQYIANLNHIVTVTATHVHLTNKREIALSSTYRQTLLDAFVNKEVIKRNIG